MVLRRTLKGVVALGLLLVVAAGLSAAIGGGGDARRIARVEELAQSPAISLDEGKLEEGRLYAVSLPEGDLVVVLRPITREEYGSYQVRAMSYDVIEREMLAAAIVLPSLDALDVAGLPASLVGFLRSQVNALSGFEVFQGLVGSVG